MTDGAPTTCPGCGAVYDDKTRLDLALTRREDGKRVCKAVWTCGSCGERWWRWNDRKTDPLARWPVSA